MDGLGIGSHGEDCLSNSLDLFLGDTAAKDQSPRDLALGGGNVDVAAEAGGGGDLEVAAE